MNVQDNPLRFTAPAAAAAAPSLPARYAPYVLSIVRIMVGMLFFQHGLSHLFAWPAPMAWPPWFSLIWFAGAIELFSPLIVLGLFTRFTAFIFSGEMAFAYFIADAPNNFYPIVNRGDAAILYCFIFLFIAFAGGGAWSVDAWWQRRKSR